MKLIYGFDDYREYLRAFYSFKKESSPGFTFQRFSHAAGIRSPNYLKLVMDGDRDLSPRQILSFAKALEFGFEETQYFEALVYFTQAENATVRAYHLRRLKQLRKAKPANSSKATRTPVLMSSWYAPAVLVCLEGLKVADAADQVARKIGIDRTSARQMIEALTKAEVLKDEQGSYRLNYAYLDVQDRKGKDLTQERYLGEQLALSQRVFKKRYRTDAKFCSHTFTIAKARFPEYEERLNQFIQELTALTNEDSPEEVVQLNTQLFRLPE